MMQLRIQSRPTSPIAIIGRVLLTTLLILVAITNIAFPLLARQWRQFVMGEPPVDLTILGWGQDGLLVISVLLLLVGHALIRGKRQAWLLMVALFVFSLLDTLIERAHWFSVAITSSVLILLLIFAPSFSIRSDRRSFVRGYGALLLASMCLSSYEIVIRFLARGQHFLHIFSRHDVLMALRLLCFFVLWYGVLSVLRPVGANIHTRQQERHRAGMIVRRYGQFALAYFTLGADKHYFWSRLGHSLIAYRVVHGVALVLSDPIGPEEEREEVLQAFLRFCQQRDWRVVFYQASRQACVIGQRYGLHSCKIGEEAIIDVESFTLQGKKGAEVRHAISRAKRGDITIECWHNTPLPETMITEMKQLSTTWMKEQKIHGQLGFSMGVFPEDWSPTLLTVVAFGPEHKIQAFLTWTPMYAGAGWSLDIMRRARETTPGTMEYLIAESVHWAKAQGYQHMSLGLAPLAGVVDTTRQSASSLIERSAAYLHQRGALLGQYRSLYAFKAKFQPHWEDRYLMFDEWRFFPQMLLALAQVHGCGLRYVSSEIWNAICSTWKDKSGH